MIIIVLYKTLLPPNRYMENEWKCSFYLIKKLPIHAWVEVWKPNTKFFTVFPLFSKLFMLSHAFPMFFRIIAQTQKFIKDMNSFPFPIFFFIITLSQSKGLHGKIHLVNLHFFCDSQLFYCFDKLAAIPKHFQYLHVCLENMIYVKQHKKLLEQTHLLSP